MKKRTEKLSIGIWMMCGMNTRRIHKKLTDIRVKMQPSATKEIGKALYYVEKARDILQAELKKEYPNAPKEIVDLFERLED